MIFNPTPEFIAFSLEFQTRNAQTITGLNLTDPKKLLMAMVPFVQSNYAILRYSPWGDPAYERFALEHEMQMKIIYTLTNACEIPQWECLMIEDTLSGSLRNSLDDLRALEDLTGCKIHYSAPSVNMARALSYTIATGSEQVFQDVLNLTIKSGSRARNGYHYIHPMFKEALGF